MPYAVEMFSIRKVTVHKDMAHFKRVASVHMYDWKMFAYPLSVFGNWILPMWIKTDFFYGKVSKFKLVLKPRRFPTDEGFVPDSGC